MTNENRELTLDQLDKLSGGRPGLVMYSSDSEPVARYHLETAWPSALHGINSD